LTSEVVHIPPAAGLTTINLWSQSREVSHYLGADTPSTSVLSEPTWLMGVVCA